MPADAGPPATAPARQSAGTAPVAAAAPGARVPLAYALTGLVGLIALASPVAVVTSPNPVDETVAPYPQILVLVASATALLGGRLRRGWPAALTLAALLALAGGALGLYGPRLLIEMHASDTDGHTGPGAPITGMVAGLVLAVVVLDTRARLVRMNPGRRWPTVWAVSLLVNPLVLVAATAFVTAALNPFSAHLTLPLPVTVLVAYLTGRALLARWAARGL